MINKVIGNFETGTIPRRVFTFLVLYRWLSLVPPLIIWFLTSDQTLLLAISLAIVVNIFVSTFRHPLNRLIHTYPWLLIADLLFMAILVALTGDIRVPFYLHAMSPLLMAAFLFGLRNALITTTIFVPLFALGFLIAANRQGIPPDWLLTVSAIGGFYLISASLGYAADLVNHLRSVRDGMKKVHRDLETIHDLSVALQSSVYVEDVQERVLEAIIGDLGFERAVVGLVDQEERIVTGWLGREQEGKSTLGTVPHVTTLPLSDKGGVIAEAMQERQARKVLSQPNSDHSWICTRFGITECHIFPMLLREHPVGVILVDIAGIQADSDRMRSLESIANQAAVAIGTTMLCIHRAQELAIHEERLRIAQDIHDTVSQSLFGIVYSLDGSLNLLPDHTEEAVPELERALRVAQSAHDELRQSILDIWPSELSSERFVTGLNKYVADIHRADELQLTIEVDGDFSDLSSQLRRGLYRITQEALSNTIQHAAAEQAQVCLDVDIDKVILTIKDDGRGFDPFEALIRDYDREHFGLRGMQERAISLGGTCEFSSQPGAGSVVQVAVPYTSKNGLDYDSHSHRRRPRSNS